MDGRDLMRCIAIPTATDSRRLPLINVWGPQKAHSLAVVTRDWKYIYWPYDQGEFEPTEELVRHQTDPLELTNLASAESAANDLVRMRALYDSVVEEWKNSAVPYHNYQKFGDWLLTKLATKET